MAASSKGNCYLCGAELGKIAMKNHILKSHSGDKSLQKCRLLKVEGAYDKDSVCRGCLSAKDMA